LKIFPTLREQSNHQGIADGTRLYYLHIQTFKPPSGQHIQPYSSMSHFNSIKQISKQLEKMAPKS